MQRRWLELLKDYDLYEPCRGALRSSGNWMLTNVCITLAYILASTSSKPACPLRWNTSLSMHFTSRSFGRSLSPIHLWPKSAWSMSYYRLIQGWLHLGKTLGYLCTPSSFDITTQEWLMLWLMPWAGSLLVTWQLWSVLNNISWKTKKTKDKDSTTRIKGSIGWFSCPAYTDWEN